MPYRRLHYFILLLLPASVMAFPFYLMDLGNSVPAKHVHAAAATLWILLLAGQSASIHNGKRSLHRMVGVASLALFPMYLAGFLLVFQCEAQRIVDGDPWATVFGPGVGTITLISATSTGWMYYAALRDRKNVQLHSCWMMVTVVLFADSVLGRIFNGYVPGFLVREFEDVRKIYDGFHASQLLAIAVAIVLYRRDKANGFPFVFVCFVLVLQSVALEIFDGFEPWRTAFIATASWPMSIALIPGVVLGIAVAWLGWTAGHREPPRSSPV